MSISFQFLLRYTTRVYILFREAGEEEWRGMLSARSRGRARFLLVFELDGEERRRAAQINLAPLADPPPHEVLSQDPRDSSRIGGIHAKGGNRMEKLSFWTILPGYSR